MVLVTVLTVGAMLSSGCGVILSNASDGWSVEKVTSFSGLAVPECATVAPRSGDVFVSNIDAPSEGPDNRYNTDDNQGFITLVSPGGKVKAMQWVKSEVNAPVNSI